MAMETVNIRDPRRQYWAQCTDPAMEGRWGTVFALSNGTLGLRGSHEEMPAWGRGEFYVAGTFADAPASLLGFHDPDHVLTHPDRIAPEYLETLSGGVVATLPNLPNPAAVELTVGGVRFSHETSKVLSNERLVEMDRAVLRGCLVFRDGRGRRTRVDSRRFVSFAEANLICLRYKVTPLGHDGEVVVAPRIDKDVASPHGVVLWREVAARREPGLNAVACVPAGTEVQVAIAQQAKVEAGGRGVTVELFIVAGVMGLDEAVRRAKAAAARSFDAHLAEHVAAWRAVADATAADFDGGADTVQGFRFGQMHLQMALGAAAEQMGVPIKGLTGCGYRFCNFWDMDFHMFPYYLLTRPREAGRLLAYRYGQLDAYRANARRWGAAGAQVPWETQTSGEEATAPWLCLPDREIHISADAAYMFKLYDELTGDGDAMVRMGAEFVFETARFYASRVAWVEANRRYELLNVGCPDQYHTLADNNVFISLMARWNLEYAAGLAGDGRYRAAADKVGLTDDEVARWRDIVAKLYVIPPNADGIIEEFDGFFGLSGDLDGVCETYCRHSQAVKQPDVVAAFWPFEHLYSEAVRRANWRFYAARTLHGSSLSLPGMAHAATRCGLNDEALDSLRASARMDLDDVNRDTERGVHLAGGAMEWYTVALGFGGLTPTREGLHFRPNLPRPWRRLSFHCCWRFRRVQVTLTRRRMRFAAAAANDGEVRVKFRKEAALVLGPGQERVVRT